MIIRINIIFVLCLCIAGCQKQHKNDNVSNKDELTSNIHRVHQNQSTRQKQLYAKGQTIQHQKEIDVEAINLDQINVDYVWTVDIPVPLKATEKKNYYEAKHDVYAIGYMAPQQQHELTAFYKEQMELLGWHCWWQTISVLETVLLFKKPHKHCAVSIRPSTARKKQDVVIMQQTV